MAAPHHWSEDAACRGVDPLIFFPASGPNEYADRQRALAYCAACPVVRQCLDDGLRNGDPRGIRGGMTERQRRKLVSR